MQAALTFQAEKARLFLGHVCAHRARGLDIADGDVALVPERVIGQVVPCEILVDFFVRPVVDRVDLDAAVLFGQRFQPRPRGRL